MFHLTSVPVLSIAVVTFELNRSIDSKWPFLGFATVACTERCHEIRYVAKLGRFTQLFMEGTGTGNCAVGGHARITGYSVVCWVIMAAALKKIPTFRFLCLCKI